MKDEIFETLKIVYQVDQISVWHASKGYADITAKQKGKYDLKFRTAMFYGREFKK